ncbi:MAG: GPW/gp25 family protein [Candidatus Hodarchaeales archaeon]|jgi:phage baseplate assembly protein W
MPLLTPRLPLVLNGDTGYQLIDNYTDLVKQNFKNLMLTVPGERIMDPTFGIGLKTFLFEIDNPLLYDDITSRIRQQVNKYMSYLEIENVTFNSQRLDEDMSDNLLSIVIRYKIVPLDLSDVLEITTPIN